MTTYLITGANRGIGLELTHQLTARGDHVIATIRNLDDAIYLCALPNTRIDQLDVADPAGIDALAHRLEGQPIDVLINNAGAQRPDMTLDAVDPDTMIELFRVNTLAPILLTRALLPNLRRGTLRRIANISTNLASIAYASDPPEGGWYAYRASKAALNMMTVNLGVELKPEGFICAAIHPGWVQTDMGGPEAPLQVHESAAGIIKVIDNLSPAANGAFLDYRGEAMPW